MSKTLQTMTQRLSTVRGVQLMVVIVALCALQFLVSALVAIPWGGVVEASCRWDCPWYTNITQNGYMSMPILYDVQHKAQANWAFFPLYPMVSRLVTWGLGVKVLTAEFLINIVLWPVVIFLCCKDMELRKITFNKFLFCVFFVLYPFNIWYNFQYSEAIYGVLLMGVIVALRSNKVMLAALLGGFLALSRPTGFVMVICLAGWWLYQSKDQFSQKSVAADRLREAALLVFAGGAGLSLFVLHLYYLTGDGFAFAHVQVSWHRKFTLLPLSIINGFSHRYKFLYSVYSVFVIYFLYVMWRKKWNLSLLLLSVTAFLGASTSPISIERYVLGNPLAIQFLAYITLSLSSGNMRKVLIGLGASHVIVLLLWYINSQSLL